MALACRIFGHRARFSSDGPVMRWRCERECGFEGEKTYSSAEAAARYAHALDRSDSSDLGKRSPGSLLPLRLGRRGRS
jgi:hypothetical protein